MPAIRKKLGWIKHGLHQLQDLGGCRVILPTVVAVYELVEAITKETRHIIREPNDYIASPRKNDLAIAATTSSWHIRTSTLYPFTTVGTSKSDWRTWLSIPGLRLWWQSDCFLAKI